MMEYHLCLVAAVFEEGIITLLSRYTSKYLYVDAPVPCRFDSKVSIVKNSPRMELTKQVPPLKGSTLNLGGVRARGAVPHPTWLDLAGPRLAELGRSAPP